jgi:hypothetical protein
MSKAKQSRKIKKRTKRLSHCLAATHNLLVSYRTYLCFMLGTSVGPHQKRTIFKVVLLCLRKLVHKIVTLCPRKDGNKWKLQKLHDLLHLVSGLYLFVHAKNFDAGRGERLLKDFFKIYASRSQERGRNIFISQVSKRQQGHYVTPVLYGVLFTRWNSVPSSPKL